MEYIRDFGDGTIAKAKNRVLPVNLNTFDSLEYDCWDLIKKYAEYFDIKLENEDRNKDDIDFYAAKAVQDAVLGLFTKAGFIFENK